MPKRNRMNFDKHYDAIVLGGGPAGLAAGIYLSRAKMKTLIISEGTIGGQMILTHEIANYPGVESISGYQLATIMKKQAKTFGCDIRSNVSVKSLELDGNIKSLSLTDGSLYTAYSIILAPGGRSRTLNVPGEDTFRGKGISYCATCDGDFFTGKKIMVVGGGNSALEEAVSLTKYASKVTIVHQFGHFQAFEHAINEARSNPKISFILESAITEFHGTDSLKSVNIKNIRTGEIRNFPAEGTFIFIGYLPNTEFLKGRIDLNHSGEIIVNSDMSTGKKGVYAAGDSIAKRYRQITTAVSDGTIAALAASEYLNKLKKEEKQLISN
jgi:thioredoxin reductase (NADPH)